MKRIFISYNSDDLTVAAALFETIASSNPHLTVYFDKARLQAGHFWLRPMFDQLDSADVMLLVVGQTIGRWQYIEYCHALKRKVETDINFTIVPILLDEHKHDYERQLPGIAQLQQLRVPPKIDDNFVIAITTAIQEGELETLQPWRMVNPFKGFEALGPEDSDFLFGREKEISQCITSIRDKPDCVHLLIGSSGVGKSSLVMAGLLPALQGRQSHHIENSERISGSENWVYLTIRPGEHAISSLVVQFANLWFPRIHDPRRVEARREYSNAIISGKNNANDLVDVTEENLSSVSVDRDEVKFFLYIDQFEEVFSKSIEPHRSTFMRELGRLAEHPRCIVCGSARADYFGHLLSETEFRRSIEVIEIPPLTRLATVKSLAAPLSAFNVETNPSSLIKDLVFSVADGPTANAANPQFNSQGEVALPAANLPILSDIMRQLWFEMQQRNEGVLQLIVGSETQRFGSSLIERAETYFAKHPADDLLLRSLFAVKLVQVPGSLSPPVRRKVDRPDLSAAEWKHIQRLAEPQWRIVNIVNEEDVDVVELPHDLIIREWPRLLNWVEEERSILSLRAMLEEAHRLWVEDDSNDKDDFYFAVLCFGGHWITVNLGQTFSQPR